jgi:hypothetical protein
VNRRNKLKDSLKINTNSADFSESRVRILFSATLLCMALVDFFQCLPLFWCMKSPPRCELCMSLAVFGTTNMMHSILYSPKLYKFRILREFNNFKFRFECSKENLVLKLSRLRNGIFNIFILCKGKVTLLPHQDLLNLNDVVFTMKFFQLILSLLCCPPLPLTPNLLLSPKPPPPPPIKRTVQIL